MKLFSRFFGGFSETDIIGRVSKGNLKSKIKFNTRVTNTIFKNDKFEVSYQDKANNKILTENFDYVVVSTAHF